MKRKSSRAAAQTASIGNQDMMTFMPTSNSVNTAVGTNNDNDNNNENGTISTTTTKTCSTMAMGGRRPSSSSSSQPQPPQYSTSATTYANKKSSDNDGDHIDGGGDGGDIICHLNVPDPLRDVNNGGEGNMGMGGIDSGGSSLLDREYSLDDEAFNASLDALLTGYEDSVCGGGESSFGGILDSSSTAMATGDDDSDTMTSSAPLSFPSQPMAMTTGGNDNGFHSAGRKRKSCGSPSAPRHGSISSHTALSTSSTEPNDPLLEMGSGLAGGAGPIPARSHLQQQPPPPSSSTQLNYSARGIVQLPPMFTSQPISLSSTTAPPPGGQSAGTVINNDLIRGPTRSGSSAAITWVGGGSQVGAQQQSDRRHSHSGLVGLGGQGGIVRRSSSSQPQISTNAQFPYQVTSSNATNSVLPSSACSSSQQQSQQHSIASSNLQGQPQHLLQGTSLATTSSATVGLMSKISIQPQNHPLPSQQVVLPQQQHQQQQASNSSSGGMYPSFPQLRPSSATSNPWDAYQSQLQLNISSNSTGPQQVTSSSSSQVAVTASAAASVALPTWRSSLSLSSKKTSATNVSSSSVNVKSSSKRGVGAVLWGDNSTLAVSEDESDKKVRRSERNLREQERSHRITERITELRTLLSEAGVHFKPDRYSTLVSVVDYIQELQARSANLDLEHKKLLNTIAVADQLANNCHHDGHTNHPMSGVGGTGGGGGDMSMTATLQTHSALENAATPTNSSSSSVGHSSSDEEVMVFIQGIDYKNIFASCGVALAITSVDGRFVDCNEEFLKITAFSRSELLGDEPRQWNGVLPPPPHAQGGGQGLVTTVSTSITANTSTAFSSATMAGPSTIAKTTSDFHMSTQLNKSGGDLPPHEIITRKQHLSLFNLLSGEDMETVYSAMSQMLRVPEHPVASISSSSRESLYITNDTAKQGTSDPNDESSSSDSFIKSNKTRSTTTEEFSSIGNEISNEESTGGVGGEASSSSSGGDRHASRYTTVDHWTGRVKHTRRISQMVSIS